MRNRVSYFDYIVTVEKENIRKTRVLLKKEIRLYKGFFNLFAEVLDELYPHPMAKAKSVTEGVVLPIVSKIAMSLRSYFDLAIKGYYHDAIILYRNMLESMLLCMLVTEKPQYAVKWLKGKVKPWEVRKELGFEDIAEAFGIMSEYVHLNVRSLGTFVEVKMEERRGLMDVSWIPKFDEDSARSMLVPSLGPILLSHLSDSYKDRLSANMLRKISGYMQRIRKVWKDIIATSRQ